MNGPDHYREAERYAGYAQEIYGNGHNEEDAAGLFAASLAQVHATLALAAATAELNALGMFGNGGTGRTVGRQEAWNAVMGNPPVGAEVVGDDA